MKKNLLKFVLLPAIICTLLGVGAFTFTRAHAAAPQLMPLPSFVVSPVAIIANIK